MTQYAPLRAETARRVEFLANGATGSAAGCDRRAFVRPAALVFLLVLILLQLQLQVSPAVARIPPDYGTGLCVCVPLQHRCAFFRAWCVYV